MAISILVRTRATGISTSSSRLVSGSTGCTGREPGDDRTNVASGRTVTLGGGQGVHTPALSVIELTLEIGLLRAVGMGRPQLRRLVRLEPSVAVGRLLAFLAIAGVLGVLAAVWPARRAAKLKMLDAIATAQLQPWPAPTRAGDTAAVKILLLGQVPRRPAADRLHHLRGCVAAVRAGHDWLPRPRPTSRSSRSPDDEGLQDARVGVPAHRPIEGDHDAAGRLLEPRHNGGDRDAVGQWP